MSSHIMFITILWDTYYCFIMIIAHILQMREGSQTGWVTIHSHASGQRQSRGLKPGLSERRGAAYGNTGHTPPSHYLMIIHLHIILSHCAMSSLGVCTAGIWHEAWHIGSFIPSEHTYGVCAVSETLVVGVGHTAVNKAVRSLAQWSFRSGEGDRQVSKKDFLYFK